MEGRLAGLRSMFFRMKRGDVFFLLGILVFSASAFLVPQLRTVQLWGMDLFGWWMAALMFVTPVAAWWRMRR